MKAPRNWRPCSHTVEVQGEKPIDMKGFWPAIIVNDGTGKDVIQTYNITRQRTIQNSVDHFLSTTASSGSICCVIVESRKSTTPARLLIITAKLDRARYTIAFGSLDFSSHHWKVLTSCLTASRFLRTITASPLRTSGASEITAVWFEP